MSRIKHVIIGLIIGIANIIPGVSGGTIAVSVGIYDKLIHSVTNMRKNFKESIRFLLPILIGIVVSIGALSFVITWLFGNYPFETNMAFIGLILGGLPIIIGKVKELPGKKFTAGNVLAFCLLFALVIQMALLGEVGTYADIQLNFTGILLLFGVGVIAAATMVIPGVSGSMVLMLLGYYQPIISYIKGFIEAVLSGQFSEAIQICGILIPFGIGVIVGIFAIAKLIEIVFRKWPLVAYFSIIGLIASSPIAIMVMSPTGKIEIMNIVAGAVLFLGGAYVSTKLGD